MRQAGQSLLEYSVLVTAVAVALITIARYVGIAFTVHTMDVDRELSGRPCPRDPSGRAGC